MKAGVLVGAEATEEIQPLPEGLLSRRVRKQISELLAPPRSQSPNSVSNRLTSAGIQIKWDLNTQPTDARLLNL